MGKLAFGETAGSDIGRHAEPFGDRALLVKHRHCAGIEPADFPAGPDITVLDLDWRIGTDRRVDSGANPSLIARRNEAFDPVALSVDLAEQVGPAELLHQRAFGVHAEDQIRCRPDQRLQPVFAMAQRQFHRLARADIAEQHADLIGRGVADGEGEDIEPASHCRRFALEPLGNPGQGNPAIGGAPLVLDIGLESSHGLADRLDKAGLLDEGIIAFDEQVIDRLARIVEDHIDDAEAFVDRLEQQLVTLVRLAPPLAVMAFPGDVAQADHDGRPPGAGKRRERDLVDDRLDGVVADRRFRLARGQHAGQIKKPFRADVGVGAAQGLADESGIAQQLAVDAVAGEIPPIGLLPLRRVNRRENAGCLGQQIESGAEQAGVMIG